MEKEIAKKVLEHRIDKISHPLCDLSMVMDNVHVLDRSTLSMSTQFFAKLKAEKLPEVFLERLNDRNVFVKIGFSSAKDNSIEVEHSIYAYLSEMAPLYSRTPNLMRYIGSFVCNDFVNYVSYLLRTEKNEDVKKLVRQIEQIKRPPSSVLSFLQMCNESLIFECMRYSLPYDGYPIKDKPFPRAPKRPGVMYKLPIGPSIFIRPIYFSLDCSLSPFEMGVQLQELIARGGPKAIEEERSRSEPKLPVPLYQRESETEEIFSD